MFWLRNKKTIFSLHTLNLRPGHAFVLGSEGKLALTDQKLSVLKAIGNMSRNTVSGAGTLQNLSTTVAELFITMLSSEGNDLEEIIPK